MSNMMELIEKSGAKCIRCVHLNTFSGCKRSPAMGDCGDDNDWPLFEPKAPTEAIIVTERYIPMIEMMAKEMADELYLGGFNLSHGTATEIAWGVIRKRSTKGF